MSAKSDASMKLSIERQNKNNRKRKKRSKKSRNDVSADRKKADFDTNRKQFVGAPHGNGKEKEVRISKQNTYNSESLGKKRKLSKDIDTKDVSWRNVAKTIDEKRCPRYPFQVDDTDHCETPLQAYRDVIDVLDRLARSLNKSRSTLRIYDPYYCDGGVKKKLASFGFASVINQNRDFYDDIDKNIIPEYDLLVTNPPYSGVHMEKILTFCSKISHTKKPFLLLLPHFVYTKDYYQRSLSSKVSSSIFFLVPEVRYAYTPPAWVEAKMGSKALEQGKTKTAPFPSFWYCHAPKEMIPPNWLLETFGPSGMVRPKHHSKLRYANRSQDIPRAFMGEFDPSKKRPNPKARKRAAKKRLEAARRADLR